MVVGLCGLPEAAEDVPKGELWVVLDDLVDGEAFAKKTEGWSRPGSGYRARRLSTDDLFVDHDAHGNQDHSTDGERTPGEPTITRG